MPEAAVPDRRPIRRGLGPLFRQRWLRRATIGLAAAILLVGGLGVLSLRRTRLVETFDQPASVTYRDGYQHTATLWHITGVGTPVGLGPDHYEVLLGSSSSYGHTVRLGATGFDPTDLPVSWEPDGAWLVYGSGHRVFVPAEEFLFGR
jgi:hypothetical protein